MWKILKRDVNSVSDVFFNAMTMDCNLKVTHLKEISPRIYISISAVEILPHLPEGLELNLLSNDNKCQDILVACFDFLLSLNLFCVALFSSVMLPWLSCI